MDCHFVGALSGGAATRALTAGAARHEERVPPMSSLQEHLDRHDFAGDTLAFRRDCPVCRSERVLGRLPSTSFVSPRGGAAVTALALATSTAVPAMTWADGQGVAVPAPPSPPPTASVQPANGGAAPATTAAGSTAGAAAAADHGQDGPAQAQTAARPTLMASLFEMARGALMTTIAEALRSGNPQAERARTQADGAP